MAVMINKDFPLYYFLLLMLSQAYNIIIDHGVSTTGHGRECD